MGALRHLGWALVCVAGCIPDAMAQQSASISGIVTDTTGGVLPGVTIEASSPVLIEKARTRCIRGEWPVPASSIFSLAPIASRSPCQASRSCGGKASR